MKHALHIVLVEPEIPQNTGNIARTCAATGATLHLVHPLGFSTDERSLKRAGLDYWALLQVVHHHTIDSILEQSAGNSWFASTTGGRRYSDVEYERPTYLFFGRETAGLPRKLLGEHPNRVLRLPMIAEARSLNLSNAVAILAYEVLRQHRFPGLT